MRSCEAMHFSVPLQYRTFTFLESSTHARPDGL